jgi:hypothetical protein
VKEAGDHSLGSAQGAGRLAPASVARQQTEEAFLDAAERLLVNSEWRAVLTEAFAEPHARFEIDMPLDALVSLVVTFNEGMMLERLYGIENGQSEPLEWIDRWLARKEAP